ncbi:DUF1822 family protein [Acaryochloris marina]|uniref:DUF1822 domain-containing protein n=1 Tax=Acaryochloris marina (strain MBIC 11017) TaxID=329726 RepID=B0C5E1_ACAM1|nr:DUF1822 family protein [Acaryochloris marina]ABW27517.1 conserved hypothetical protein [Acaryochloris marina MBIC11017]
MTSDLALFDATYLEIDADSQAQAWQQNDGPSRWQAYLNQLCLETVIPWLREDHALRAIPALKTPSLQSIWAVVTGTPIQVGAQKIVLIPTETIDLDELRVPQEWIDIPNWMADYYVATQVNPDEGWVRIGGFTKHLQLKEQGAYDWCDRTYTLNDMDLTSDLNVLWLTQQFNPQEITQAAVNPLPALSKTQADQLIQRLGNSDLVTPRLAIPFEAWGSLMAHGGWRQRLAAQRRGITEQPSVGQWLQTGMTNLAQQIGWQAITLQPQLSAARGDQPSTPTAAISRQLQIEGQPYELNIYAVEAESAIWRFELHPVTPGARIPAGFVLRLRTEELEAFEGNEDQASEPVDRLYIDVALASGEALVWAIEPQPEQYDQEILRF